MKSVMDTKLKDEMKKLPYIGQWSRQNIQPYIDRKETHEALVYRSTLHNQWKLHADLASPENRERNIQIESNKFVMEYYSSSGHSTVEFCGGYLEDLRKDRDMTEYLNREKEILSQPFAKKINDTVGTVNKRRRTMSEHDGDWDLDRRWDVKPFSGTAVLPTPVRTIELMVTMEFSSAVPAKEIEKYGQDCTAIITLLESKGFTVGLTLQKRHREIYADVGKKDKDRGWFLEELEIKKPGEYMPKQRILQVFSPLFMRRVLFCNVALACEAMGRRSYTGISYPTYQSVPIYAEPGKLYIFNTKFSEKLDDLERAIKTALGQS